MKKRLTEMTKTSGCAAKIGPGILAEVITNLPKMNSDKLLVGIENSDDAAVYKLTEDIATIQTLDFFTPIIDDPYLFGQIAAANSLSDIYAMGGKPIVALNIVCFPNCLPLDILSDILRGGADKVIEAGAIIAGGHSIQDDEPKYGLSVTGIVNPKKILKNGGCNDKDVIILTKPLGTGIISIAIKGDVISKTSYDEAVKVMATLNKYVSEIIERYDITACTDVTGFGLMGHAYEMAKASGKTLIIYKESIPYLEGAKEYAKLGLIPMGSYNNRKYIEGSYIFHDVEAWMEDILFDPQTSGGLLFTCSEESSIDLMMELNKLEIKSKIIGEVHEHKEAYIQVI